MINYEEKYSVISETKTTRKYKMEFERSIFRMHEKLLLAPACPRFTKYLQRFSCLIFVYLLLSFVVYHKLYANRSDILTQAIES